MFRRCQAEVDRVVGRDRLPTFEDRPFLPYVDWVVWECLRWNPGMPFRLHCANFSVRAGGLKNWLVTPLGVAHSVTEDDVYEGYWIPRGTTVLPNIW